MPKLLESAKRIGRRIGLDDENGYGIAIFLALIVVVAVIASYFAASLLAPPTVGYNTIYLLDANQTAVDYTQVLAAGQSSTLNVWVENHNSNAISYQIQVKITNNLSSYPLASVQPFKVLESGDVPVGGKWNDTIVVQEDSPGNYAVVFELYKHNGNGTLEFTENYCVLNIQVI